MLNPTQNMVKGGDVGCHAPINGTEMREVDRGLFLLRRGWFGHLQHRSRDHRVKARGRRVEPRPDTRKVTMTITVPSFTPDQFLRPLDVIRSEHDRQLVVCDRIENLANDRQLESVLGAAKRLLAYLTKDLPLHCQDEEEDLFRMLRLRCRPEDGIDAILAELDRDHATEMFLAHSIAPLGAAPRPQTAASRGPRRDGPEHDGAPRDPLSEERHGGRKQGRAKSLTSVYMRRCGDPVVLFHRATLRLTKGSTRGANPQ